MHRAPVDDPNPPFVPHNASPSWPRASLWQKAAAARKESDRRGGREVRSGRARTQRSRIRHLIGGAGMFEKKRRSCVLCLLSS